METWMAEGFKTEGVYDYYGKYEYRTPSNSIGLDVVKQIDNIVTGNWGWHFNPTNQAKWSDPYNDEWYKEQQCVITFDSKEDLVQVILEVGKRL